jgi:mannose-1-phosphate guanylyltransferase/phosphomannomutase
MPRIKLLSPKPHVFIVAGGKGSRSLDRTRAKILQELSDGYSILDLHLEKLKESGLVNITMLLGEHAEQVIEYLERKYIDKSEFNFDWLLDDGTEGTLGALTRGVSFRMRERYLVILGDVAISANYHFLLKRWDDSNTNAAVLVHPNLHPFDSDKVLADSCDLITEIIPKRQSTHMVQPLRSAAGCYFFNLECFTEFCHVTSGDISLNFLPELIQKTSVLALNSSYFFKDSGTPDRLNSLRKNYTNGSIARRGKSHRPAIFLDRDGTLFPNSGTARRWLSLEEVSAANFQAISKANELGIPVFVVTNQPGVAKGQITIDDVLSVQAQYESYAAKESAFIDDFRICPHHPQVGFQGEISQFKVDCDCRKPKVGMFHDLAAAHSIDLGKSTFIGDTEVDRQSASNLNMSFKQILKHEDLHGLIEEVVSEILNDNF